MQDFIDSIREWLAKAWLAVSRFGVRRHDHRRAAIGQPWQRFVTKLLPWLVLMLLGGLATCTVLR